MKEAFVAAFGAHLVVCGLCALVGVVVFQFIAPEGMQCVADRASGGRQ